LGAVGELHIGGVALARGYLNAPDLTANKFIPHPFGDVPGARLYKTGDLVRYRSDGNIEFLGRIDQQVKIRGFRVEPGEIEAILGQHPGVAEAVVVAQEDERGDKRLVAYVVCRENPEPAPAEMRSFLKSKLPGYMIPSAFVRLKALPLTPNGKLDRKALPAADPSAVAFGETFIVPGTPAERTIAEIWTQVLKLEKVGIHDDFFDLGGHSLLATQVVSRVRDAFQLELPVRVLFEKPTIEELALTIEEAIIAEIESQP
jgi:acyl carrier protein